MRAKEELPECPVATAVSLIGGKWKLLILRNLKERPWRFNELQRSIDGISQKVLTDSLRQMMSDGLAYRHDYHEQPPRVEYGLTELGTKMLPIVNSLADFGNYYKSTPFIKYMLQVILSCYKEFEERVGLMSEKNRSTVCMLLKLM